MSIGRILLITVLISSIIVAAAFFNLESEPQDHEVAEVTAPATPGKAESPPAGEPAAPPPLPADADMLAPDEFNEDAEYEKEQIDAAMTQLNSANTEERIEAVEQLGAYPTPATEATLSQILTSDANAEVRNAAALSLGSLDDPSEATIATLLSALEDPNEEVRFSALSTLEDLMLGQEEDSRTYQRIHDALGAKAAAKNLPQDLRESIQEVIRDQQEMAAPDMTPDD